MDALQRLRARAFHGALFPPTTLGAAMDRMGFVQADPIRAPARAQDLILRHRVRSYRAGNLDRGFRALGLEEDFLYAHGFMPARTRHLLHPRRDRDMPDTDFVPSGLAAAVLAHARGAGTLHPREVAATFGQDRAVNAWGGFSKATTRALEQLHHHGLLRIAGRVNGIRTYEATAGVPHVPAAERARSLVMLVARTLAPVSMTSLNGALALMARHNPGLGPLRPVLAEAVRTGALEPTRVDGEAYLAPPGAEPPAPVQRSVRLLAPFDPLVWDRRRFEHLWGWAYRFEAYTPPGKRQFGYYALPLAWGDRVIGWANLTVTAGRVSPELGFPGPAPRSLAFRRACDAELARFERFLPASG